MVSSIVPESVPLDPDPIWAHVSPDVTEAVHDIVPVPVFETSKLVEPFAGPTDAVIGFTVSTGSSLPDDSGNIW